MTLEQQKAKAREMISLMHDSHITKPPHVVITFTELDTLIEATYKSAIEECVRVISLLTHETLNSPESESSEEYAVRLRTRNDAYQKAITTLKADK